MDSCLNIELNKIIHGDCLEIMQQIKSKSVGFILCDLPYGTTQCKWDTVIPFAPLWEQYNRIIKPNGAVALFGAEPFSSYLRLSNIDNFKYDWIWDKIKGTGFLNAKKQPMRNHEIVSVFYKNQCLYIPQKTTGHVRKKTFRSKDLNTEVYGKMKKDFHYNSTDRYPQSIQVFSSDTQNSSLHPTQKPVSFCQYLIETYTNEGDIVLDNCIGSGTTAIACINTKRNFIGIETEKKYVDIANKRINNHNKKLRLF